MRTSCLGRSLRGSRTTRTGRHTRESSRAFLCRSRPALLLYGQSGRPEAEKGHSRLVRLVPTPRRRLQPHSPARPQRFQDRKPQRAPASVGPSRPTPLSGLPTTKRPSRSCDIRWTRPAWRAKEGPSRRLRALAAPRRQGPAGASSRTLRGPIGSVAQTLPTSPRQPRSQQTRAVQPLALVRPRSCPTRLRHRSRGRPHSSRSSHRHDALLIPEHSGSRPLAREPQRPRRTCTPRLVFCSCTAGLGSRQLQLLFLFPKHSLLRKS